MTITLEEVQPLIEQLSLEDKARLRDALDSQLTVPMPARSDVWERLRAFQKELAALGDAAPSATEQLFEDRRERQALIEGRLDVHH
ncbi:MAG: hypothetical protein MUD01_00610 [Chloroflexaceae bacterium]|jgi:hypothetical protein|nr:hypothetical protein [Chloroflexaceae bacterium]